MASTISLVLARALDRFEREEGQGLTEYALILALVSVAAVIALGALGTILTGTFDDAVGSF